MSFIYFGIWFAVGFVAALPLLVFAHRLKRRTMTRLMGRSLIAAAIIYIGFAALWGDAEWLAIETLGVVIYGFFYWLAIKHSDLWIGVGWLLHPVWDVALHLLGPGSHVAPAWYAVACLSFDFVVAAYIFKRLRSEDSKG